LIGILAFVPPSAVNNWALEDHGLYWLRTSTA